MKRSLTLLLGALALSPAACKKSARKSPAAVTTFDAMTRPPAVVDAGTGDADAQTGSIDQRKGMHRLKLGDPPEGPQRPPALKRRRRA